MYFKELPVNRHWTKWSRFWHVAALHSACEARFNLTETLKELLHRLEEHLGPSCYNTYGRILHECSKTMAFSQGKQVHAHIIGNKIDGDVFLGNHLLHMYGKCGCLYDARKVFDNLPYRSIVSWNTLIAAHGHQGRSKDALQLFFELDLEGLRANAITLINTLKACSASLAEGKLFHAHVVSSRFDSDVVLLTGLLDMYGKCGSLQEAYRLFQQIFVPDVVSCNAMVTAYANYGLGHDAIELYMEMEMRGPKPNKVTFISLLKACFELLIEGKLVHARILGANLQSDVVIQNSLLTMYSKNGCWEDAYTIFSRMSEQSVVSWNILVTSCADQGHGKEVLLFISHMHSQAIEPNDITFVNGLITCSNPEFLPQGALIHASILHSTTGSFMVQNSLLKMYASTGDLDSAYTVFDGMKERDVESWNAIIAGYAQHGDGKMALDLLQQMRDNGVEPDAMTYPSILDACGDITALEEGILNHIEIIDRGFDSDVVVNNALINMYSKCGNLEHACTVFDQMCIRNVVSWTVMIVAYAQHGHGEIAIQIFEWMQVEGLQPNEITFIGVISACSHAGLVDEGQYYFNLMYDLYSVIPSVDHYSCLIDLFGRAGRLYDAERYIGRMTLQPSAILWLGLLGACRTHGAVERGERAAKEAIKLDPENTGPYTLLANIYAEAGRLEDAERMRRKGQEITAKNQEAIVKHRPHQQ